jgi:AcrR family transcriptional regulator
MDQKEKPKRKYHSSRRQEQARETRQRILDAALKQFSSLGYAGATIEAIAHDAGVSPLTIFSTFGNKRSILTSLIDVLVGGDERPIPLLQRPGPQSVLQESDPYRQVRQFAADITNSLERMAPIFEIMRMAAKTESEIATLLDQVLKRRLHNIGVFVQSVAAHANLLEGQDAMRATETVWSIASPEVYRLLAQDRSWTKERFANWLGDTLVRLLLP